jgi:hypothetical protein
MAMRFVAVSRGGRIWGSEREECRDEKISPCMLVPALVNLGGKVLVVHQQPDLLSRAATSLAASLASTFDNEKISCTY